MTDNWLDAYLQDHEAASVGGIALFHRVAGTHSDPDVRTAVRALAAQVEEDQRTLQQIMVDVGAGQSQLKRTAAWLGEKLGRLAPNGRLLSRSPLTDLLELEALSVAVEGKLRAWLLLHEVVADRPELGAERIVNLADRAREQRDTLERLRLDVGSGLLAPTG